MEKKSNGTTAYSFKITERKYNEEALRKSEEKYRLLAENISDVIWILDTETMYFTYVSPSVKRLRGYTSEEILAEPVTHALTVNASSYLINLIHSRVEDFLAGKEVTGRYYTDEVEQPCKDGSTIWTEVITSYYNNKENGRVEVLGITRDISERKLSKDALIDNERLLRESQNIARLGSFVWDISSGLWKSSKILDEIFGINENYIRSFDGWTNIVHPGWRAVMTDYVNNNVIGKHQKFDKEYQIIRQEDGQIRWVHGISELELDNDNQPTRLIGTIIDITEHKQANLAFVESEERFRSLFENSTIGIYRTTPAGQILLANPTLVRILGYSTFEELSKRNLEHEGFEPAYERSKFLEVMKRDNEVKGMESSWIRHDGIKIFIRESARAIRSKDNNILYFDGTVEDITERKLAEQELEERTNELQKKLEERKTAEKELKESHKQLEDSKLATLNLLEDIKLEMEQRKKVEEEVKKLNSELEKRVMERTSQLEEANKELQAFAYSVSHDLRAPLRAINGFSEFIEEDYGAKLDPEGKRLLGLIRSNTRKMDQLITDILSLSRVTRGEHNVSKIDMTKMAMSILNETASSEIQKKIRIIVDELPEACADPTYMKQVWINLISNAIKFSSLKKKPEIKIGSYTEVGFNVYYIKDNGVGFNPEYAHKLFGVFQRLHKPDEFEGTGVGLAIVQRIIHRHGGKVWAEGKENSGSTFYFSIPVDS